MQGLFRLIEHELINKILSGQATLSTLNKGEQSFMILCVLFVGAGSGFLIYAAHLWLVGNYPADMAAALTGVLSLTFALVIAVAVYSFIAYKRARIVKLRQNIVEKVKLSLSTLEDECGDPIRDNPKMSILIASLAGFVLEERVF